MLRQVLLFVFVTLVSARQEHVSNKRMQLPLKVFYQTLCPAAKEYIVDEIGALMRDPEFASLLDVQLFPMGNRGRDDEKTLQCEHGHRECHANIMHACALKHLPKAGQFRFVVCTLNNMPNSSPESAGKTCLEPAEYEVVQACMQSTEGADRIDEIHKFLPQDLVSLPWVVLDDERIGFDVNLVNTICTKYHGFNAPTKCGMLNLASSAESQLVHGRRNLPCNYNHTANNRLVRSPAQSVDWLKTAGMGGGVASGVQESPFTSPQMSTEPTLQYRGHQVSPDAIKQFREAMGGKKKQGLKKLLNPSA